MENSKYIWIFGGKNETALNSNIFSFWKYCLQKYDEIDKFIILKNNGVNLKLYDNLKDNEKDHVIWFNSKEHIELYGSADLVFISDSTDEVVPNRNYKWAYDPEINKSIIIIPNESGSLVKSKITGESFNNSIFRYCVFDENDMDILKEKNNFNQYQLKYVRYPLKYDSEFSRKMKSESADQILWFVEWRYYNDERDEIANDLINTLKSNQLKDYLDSRNLNLKVCLHRYYKKEMFKDIYSCENGRIQIFNENDADVNDEMFKSQLLITDYSPIAFDFTFLDKPVLLYQPDLDYVYEKRQFNLEYAELDEHAIRTSDELIKALNENDFKIHPIFDRFDKNSFNNDNSHIEELYDYLYDIQMNKITFLGYNFYGFGGTVNATKALAEGLVNHGYLVEMFSLFKKPPISDLPNGINFNHAFDVDSRKGRVKTFPFKFIPKYGYLRHEANLEAINPYSSYRLKKLLKNIKSHTVVSTRDTLHLYLEEAKSEFIKNKLYFFHASADVVDVMYPGLMSKLKNKRLSKAVFVTENNRLEFERLHDYTNYDSYIVTGNALESSKVIERDEIKPVTEKEIYKGIYLLRISTERKADIDNLFEFGEYLKKNNIENILESMKLLDALYKSAEKKEEIRF